LEDLRAISGVEGEQVGCLLGALVLVRIDTGNCIDSSGVIKRGGNDLAVDKSAG
jgi:hypothetical protein